MDKMDYVLTSEFYLDNTMSREFDTPCPRCQFTDIVKAHSHDETEMQMRTYLGCKRCHFRWVKGRKLTCLEQLKKSGLLK